MPIFLLLKIKDALAKYKNIVYDTIHKEKKMRKKLIILFCVFLLIVGMTIFILQKKKQAETKQSDIHYEKMTMMTNLRLGVSEFDSIHPFITKNRDVLQIDQLIFEPLLTISENYQVKPCLAKEWSKVGKNEYILKLVQTAKWHDETLLTASDVKFTIDLLKKISSIYSENVKKIKLAEAIDDNTMKITLYEEVPFFEYNLIFPIISKAQYEGKQWQEDNVVPLGTGPYKIQKMEGNTIELVKNENWRDIDDKNSNLQTISITKYHNMGELYNAFKIGNLDFFQTTNQQLEEYIGSMGYQKKEYLGREFDYLAFNCKNEALQYQEVRQALSLATHHEEMISSVFQNTYQAAYFPLDYGSYVSYATKVQSQSDEEAVEKLLKQNGWNYEYGIWQKQIDGKRVKLQFQLTVNESDKNRLKAAEEIKKQWERVGIQVTLKPVSNSAYQHCLATREYEILLTGIYNSYSPDLTTFFGESNLANYENEELQNLLQEVTNIQEENLQKEKYQRIAQIAFQEVPYLGLYRNKKMVIYSNHLMGDVQPNNYSLFYHIYHWYRQ